MTLRVGILAILSILLITVFSPGLIAASAAQDRSALAAVKATPTPQSGAVQSGPESFPPGVNPLTGLPVSDPASLSLPPAMISVANFPVSGRPQAGLSYAPYVFELFIGEGMTRFLALFYGDYPELDEASASQPSPSLDNAGIGPIRSGRMPYQSLRKLYNGFLVMASASSEVRSELSSTTNVYGSDTEDINSARIDVNRLQALAEANKKEKAFSLTGNRFSLQSPTGGQQASKLWVFYAVLNQVLWTYDPASQAYLRQQDMADGSGKFYPSTDRLTGEQLAFENVVVLFVRHNVLNSTHTLIDLDLLYTGNKAYLFRDGKVYPIYWTTANGAYEKKSGLLRPVRFVDKEGNSFPLRPGKTWVEVVDVTATMVEKEPGYWKARFYAP
jgi:hypothetical protein